MLWLILISALWVFWDASKHKIGKIPGVKGTMSPVTWAICTLGFWIIAFPMYLMKRKKLIELAKEHPVKVSGVGKFIIVVLFLLVTGLGIAATSGGSIKEFEGYAVMIADPTTGIIQPSGTTLKGLIQQTGATSSMRFGSNVYIKRADGKTMTLICKEGICAMDISDLF